MELFLIIGIILYAAIAIDILQTTLSMQGGGWLTSRLSHMLWNFFRLLSGKNGRSRLLGHAGYILLISIVLVWVFFLWASFISILYAFPGIVIDSTTKNPADLIQLIYYAGFSISTLGMGDYVPATQMGRILTSVYSYTGLILITMSVTYLIPVLSAVIEQRKLGVKLSALGNSPQKIVINGWNGDNFDRFVNKIDQFSDAIVKYSQQHRAYPVIHYFHDTEPKTTIILQLARLYEALQILKHIVPEGKRPKEEDLRPLGIAFENYFNVIIRVTHISITDSEPGFSKIDKLKELQSLNNGPAVFRFNGAEKEHRRFFNSLLCIDGWSWNELDVRKS